MTGVEGEEVKPAKRKKRPPTQLEIVRVPPAPVVVPLAPILPSPSELAPGLHLDVTPEQYYRRELGVVSKSALDYVLEAPAVYKAWIDGELADEDSEALAFGRAFHVACLEPARFADAYAVSPDFGDCRYAGPKASRDAWRREHSGKTWIAAKEGKTLRGMAMALARHPVAAKILASGLAESTLRWDDEGVGLPCKGRPDWLCPDIALCADLKSAMDPSERAFQRDCENYGYHRQDAFYRDGLEAVGQGVDTFLFIVIGKSPPHLVGLYSVRGRDVERGRETNRRLMRTLSTCVTKGIWPGLPESVVEVSLRKWAV
jgi:hypothetical protein